MNKRVIVFICFLFFLFTFTSQAQTKFSGNTETYIAELTDFFNESSDKSNRKQAKEFIEEFTIFWNSGEINDMHKKSIADLSIEMQKRKMQAFPHFFDYLTVVKDIIQSKQSEKIIINWHIALSDYVKRKTSAPFQEFLSFSKDFFLDSLLNNSTSSVWKVNTSTFDFIYEEEPILVFPQSFNLVCYANNDSSVIYNTTGKFFPKQNKWQGEKGRINWTRAGFEPDALYAEFDRYELNTRKREFTIDTVRLYYPEMFGNQVLTGVLEERILANRTKDNAIYPAFQTTDSRFEIKNIFKDINYEGGYSIKGAKLIGSGDRFNDAYLYIYKDDKLFMKFSAQSYIIRKDRISSERAGITIYWEEDSIYHPCIPMKYIDETREISAIREREGLSRMPYINSYHQLEMDFEAMYWKMDEHKIDFRMIIGPGSEGNATFTSNNYYSDYEYEKIRGIDDMHPLVALKNCSRKNGSRSISVEDFARCLVKQEESVRNEIIRLALAGFVHYNINTDRIFIKDKVFDYLSASAKRKDYDVIKLNSVITAQSNATLSLLDFDLKMRGVSRIFVSDSQSVYIFPLNQEITIKKNRDFEFNGLVRVGLFDFFGNNFYFDYEQFKVEMPLIDSLSFRVLSRKPDEYGSYPLVRVKSTIEAMSGNVLIDHPSNKSGLKPFKEYPIFNSQNPSYVYYDKKCVYPDIYKRENFFYRIEPFQLDSMNALTTDQIEFSGYLSSAGIFPTINEPIKVQEDYSLGFNHLTPEGGLEAYEGKGTFENIIDISNQGLRGDGVLSYLTSVSESDQYIFFPEKTISESVKDFNVAESKTKTEYPIVDASNVRQEWRPHQDVMVVESKATPFEIFKEKTLLTGKLELKPTALSGEGLMEFSSAQITSENFVYTSREINSDTCDFSLKTYDLKEMAFVTENYKTNISMDAKVGKFKSNGGSSMVKFPANQYICFMDQFDWYMDKDEIDLTVSEQEIADYSQVDIRHLTDLDLSGSEFISIHPKQDSLRFKSPKAKYSLREQVIRAFNVEMIRVADAAIVPSDGNVTVLKNADMQAFEKAKILANTVTKYHVIYDANIKVTGRNDYTANGKYDYIDEIEESQMIYFSNIKVDSSLQTIAQGNIELEHDFTLSPFFDYYGKVELYANNKNLFYSGGTRIKHECDTITKRWLSFKAEIDPLNVVIPLDSNLRDMEKNKLYNGIFYSTNDSVGVYPALLSPKILGGDIELASAEHYLTYDKPSNEYRVSSLEKLTQLSLPGNYFSLDRLQCISYAEGKLSLGANLGRVLFDLYGNIQHYSADKNTVISSVITLDFYFNDDAMKIFQEGISNTTGLEGINLNNQLYSKYLGEVVGLEHSDKIMSEIGLYGQIRRFPKELEHTITFTDIKFIFNPATKSYVSEGKIGINTIGKHQINRYVDGKIELQLRRGGDRLSFYVETSPNNWFYFNYANGLMQAISSFKEFNDYITNAKADSRQISAKDGQKAYSYYISTAKRKDAFLKKIEYEEEEIE